MNFTIETDSESGFCHGVIRAIEKAEENLGKINNLYSLGAIVHNNAELERLHNKGLVIINKEQMESLKNSTVLIRAHGEPPATYKIAQENNIDLIDCTCPVVLKLQKRIKKSYQSGYQIIIFGKHGHAEVNGLVGQVGGDAAIVDYKNNKIEGIDQIDFTPDSKPISIFSQTTKDPKEYLEVCSIIKEMLLSQFDSSRSQSADEYIKSKLLINNTICKQVEHRHSNLQNFAKTHSIILFISGAESSNGKILYDLCKSANERSYHIESSDDIDLNWFRENDNIGLCGATSTPKWQLDKIVDYLTIRLKNHV